VEFETVKQFVDDVDLILSEPLLQKDGGGVELYFDTADVRGAALGMYAYYEKGSFQGRLFDQPRALVRALMARGDLGRFQLLSAHQAEFLSLMNEGFSIREEDNLSRSASEFWKDAGILKEATPLRDLSPAQITNLVQQQAGNAANYFKAVEAIRGSWRWRLKDWRQNKTFEISSTPEDYTKHLTSDVFAALKDKLDRRRESLTDNNLADAISLVSLMQKVEAFNQGRTRILPFFYAATRQFLDVVNAVGCGDRLKAVLPSSGERVSILRHADYFVLRAIFLAADDGTSSPPRRRSVFTVDELRSIHADVSDMLRTNKTLTFDQLAASSHAVAPEKLNELIDNVRDLSFFDNVWLPYRAERDTQTSLRRLRAEEYVLGRAKLQDGLKTAVAEVRDKLQANHDRMKILRALWKDLPTVYGRLGKSLRPHADTESNLMRRTGLLRFSFPQPTRDQIFRTLASLLSSEQQRRKDALTRVVQSYFAALDDPRRGSHAEIAAAALWVAEMDTEILTLLHVQRREHFSLDLVYAASAVRAGDAIDRALETYETLERRLSKAVVPVERAEIAMGLAYLYYHLWNRCDTNMNVLQRVRRQLRCQRSALIQKAVKYARDAYVILQKSADEPKMVYVLNQIAYFMSLSNLFELHEVQPFADRLMKYEKRDLWQYRFDDTLARFYLFWSLKTKDYADKVDILKMGVDRAKKARREAPEDMEILETFEILNGELLKIRGRRLPEMAPVA
jgi:hypothetical protein